MPNSLNTRTTMTSSTRLTGDFITKFYNKTIAKQPTLQVLHIGEGFYLSDGNHYIKGILNDNLGLTVPTDLLVITLGRYNRVITDDKRILLEVLAYTRQSKADAHIGTPKNIDTQASIGGPSNLKRKGREDEGPDSDYTNPQVKAKLTKMVAAKLKLIDIQAVVMQKTTTEIMTRANGHLWLTIIWVYTSQQVIKIMSANKDTTQTHPLLEEGMCYRFSHLEDRQHLYREGQQRELHIIENTDIKLVSDEEPPALPFCFTPLNALQSCNTSMAIAAVIVDIGAIVHGMSKSGKPYNRLDVHLADDTGVRIKLTLWSQSACEFMGMRGDCLVMHSVKVAKFKGYLSLELTLGACLLLNPEKIPCNALQEWYKKAERGANGIPAGLVSAREIPKMSIANADAQLDATREKVIFAANVFISYINDDRFAYLACKSCPKKIHDKECKVHGSDCGEGRWLYRLDVHFKQGETGRTAIAFNEIGLGLFGIGAGDLESLKNSDEEAFNAKFAGLMDKEYDCVFALGLKQEDQVDIAQYTILSAKPM